MPASPNLSYRIRDEIDEVYTFPIKHKQPGYDRKEATVLVSYDGESNVKVILHDPPGMQGYHENYPINDNPKRERKHELAEELLDYAKHILGEYEVKTSSWRANSGNLSLSDIYVEVDRQEVDQVLVNMYQILHHARNEYMSFLQEFEPDQLVEPTSTLEERVQDIIGSADGTLSLPE